MSNATNFVVTFDNKLAGCWVQQSDAAGDVGSQHVRGIFGVNRHDLSRSAFSLMIYRYSLSWANIDPFVEELSVCVFSICWFAINGSKLVTSWDFTIQPVVSSVAPLVHFEVWQVLENW
ncbi:hypothetical protein D3C75_946700 [compost metagenome]